MRKLLKKERSLLFEVWKLMGVIIKQNGEKIKIVTKDRPRLKNNQKIEKRPY